MKKVLFIASVDSHFTAFHLPYISYFKEAGFEVHLAAAGEESFSGADKKYNLPFSRTPFSYKNIKVLRALKKIINENQYSLVICNTPVASAVGRIAAVNARKKYGARVVYIAHGLSFWKGSPKRNWLVFYPVEWFAARKTDVIITINNHDYELAKRKLGAKSVLRVPGIGFDYDYFSSGTNRGRMRRELGLSDTDIMLLSVGELSKRKNHRVIIESAARISNPRIHYVIAGCGALDEELKKYAAAVGFSDKLHMLGFRQDVRELCGAADIYCFPSIYEGLPIAPLEGMASGLPLVASRIRGNVDICGEGQEGFLVDPTDVSGFSTAIRRLTEDDELRLNMGARAKEKSKEFGLNLAAPALQKIFGDLIRE